MAGNKDTALSSQHSAHGKPGSTTFGQTKKKTRPKSRTQATRKSKSSKSTPRRRSRRNRIDDERVTTFHEAEGKVIREVMLSHEGGENVLVIDFEDRTALSFEIDPEPLVLPVDIRAHYLGTRSSADRKWENLSK